MARRLDLDTDEAVLVIGLGRFGSAVAETLASLGHDVLAVDSDGALVQEWADRLAHVVEADSTSVQALQQLGAKDVRVAVVAIGTDIEASLLTASALIDLGVGQVWAKAVSEAHGRILERIGATHVVFPEQSMGERVAYMLTGRMSNFVELDDDYAIAKVQAPRECDGKTLGEAALRSKYGVTVVGVKRGGGEIVPAQGETLVREGDELVIAGPTAKVQDFSSR
ncbi:MAG: potassium channel family protein [Actinomycetes bacterium]